MTVEQYKKANELIIKIGKFEHEIAVIQEYRNRTEKSPIRFGDNFNVSIPMDIFSEEMFKCFCDDMVIERRKAVEELKQEFNNI